MKYVNDLRSYPDLVVTGFSMEKALNSNYMKLHYMKSLFFIRREKKTNIEKQLPKKWDE